MNPATTTPGFGVLVEPATLKIERVLPGPIERVWSYLTDSELRRQWLASGDMGDSAGAALELVWRNDELTDPPGRKPEGFGVEHRMQGRVLEYDPPHKLAFTWQGDGEVSIELREQGSDVLLTLVHRRLPDRNMTLMVGAGWHAHLDVLAARLGGRRPGPFWDDWTRLKSEYDRRLPG